LNHLVSPAIKIRIATTNYNAIQLFNGIGKRKYLPQFHNTA